MVFEYIHKGKMLNIKVHFNRLSNTVCICIYIYNSVLSMDINNKK